MTTPSSDERGRPHPPAAADEASTLLGFLEFHRATLAWKTDGLDAGALDAALPPSTMTLGGLLTHLAFVEDYWFGYRFAGRDPSSPWLDADWDADPDHDWHCAADLTPEEVRTLWRTAAERSRAVVSDTLADGGLDRLSARAGKGGSAPSLRWVLVHMVEEYARHNGHADLLREAVDGLRGE